MKKINKKLKNNLLFSALILGLLSIALFLIYFFQNKLAFKIFNNYAISFEKKGNFEKANLYFDEAGKKYPNWLLAIKSNKLGILYQEKKYQELDKKIKEIKAKKCSLKQKSISPFCENIFYLDGLVQYRIGEKKEEKEQKKYFKDAVKSFETVLKINPQNLWAKENIDFILNRQKKEEQKNKEKESKNGQNKKYKNDKKAGENNEQKNQSKNDEKENSEKKNGDSKKDNSSNSNRQKTAKNKESRLPQNIQRALAERKKELEKDQKNQKGFARSKAKAEEEKNRIRDPFDDLENDPFFQAFFGNDPFFNQAFHKKNLRKNLTNPDEKDW